VNSDGSTHLLESVVIYDGLPVSSGGAHGIQRLHASAAIEAWHGFLDECTERASVVAGFTVADGVKLPRDVARQLKRRFGDQHEWLSPWFPFSPERWDEAAAWLQEVLPVVTDAVGYASLYLTADASFALKRPNGPGVWEGQAPEQFGSFETPSGFRLGSSTSRLTVTSQRSMSLMVSLPLATDEEAHHTRRWMQEYLPFRLSSKHWSRWTLTGSGQSYRGRRITLP